METQRAESEDRRIEWKKRAEKMVGGVKTKKMIRKLIFGQRGRGREVAVHCSIRKGEKVKRVRIKIRKLW
jgi:hypothetical protein